MKYYLTFIIFGYILEVIFFFMGSSPSTCKELINPSIL